MVGKLSGLADVPNADLQADANVQIVSAAADVWARGGADADKAVGNQHANGEADSDEHGGANGHTYADANKFLQSHLPANRVHVQVHGE